MEAKLNKAISCRNTIWELNWTSQAGTQRHDVVLASMRRDDVASMPVRRHSQYDAIPGAMCSLGGHFSTLLATDVNFRFISL